MRRMPDIMISCASWGTWGLSLFKCMNALNPTGSYICSDHSITPLGLRMILIISDAFRGILTSRPSGIWSGAQLSKFLSVSELRLEVLGPKHAYRMYFETSLSIWSVRSMWVQCIPYEAHEPHLLLEASSTCTETRSVMAWIPIAVQYPIR